MNLADVIAGHGDDSPALISRGEITSYGELRRLVAGARGALALLGVRADDRVVILAGNTRHFVVAYLAVVGLGAVAVPLNPGEPAPAVHAAIEHVEPVAVVVDPVGSTTWASVDRATLPASLRHIVVAGRDAAADEESLEQLSAGEPMPAVDVAADHLAALLFTSGTAGAPRAAMLTHGNLLANIAQSSAVDGALRASDVVLCVLPLFHIFGLNVVLGQTLSAGGSIVLVQRFDPATALDTVVERKITVVPGAPPMWVSWSQFTEAPAGAFASVRLALTGAAAMPAEAAETFRDRFGLPLREGYGLTEAAPVVTTSVGIQPRTGSIGKVLAGNHVRIVDGDGADVLDGDPGEIWVRGPNVFAGYWHDDEATARVLVDGWLRTGDIAVMDDDGYLSLVDRAKDLIIVSGFNVYPAEVEQVIAELDGVAEVAVVGVAHPHTGEAVKAYVVAAPGVELHEDPIIDHCHEHLARYKCPTKVLVVPELPHNAAGKVLRRVLR